MYANINLQSSDSSLVTSIKLSFIVESTSVFDEIQAHLNYSYLATWMFCSGTLYTSSPNGVRLPWYSAFDSCWLAVFFESSKIIRKNIFIYYREKLQCSPLEQLPVSYVFLWSMTHYSFIWGHKLVSICRFLHTSDNANSLLEIQKISTLCLIHSSWDIWAKARMKRNGANDQIL